VPAGSGRIFAEFPAEAGIVRLLPGHSNKPARCAIAARLAVYMLSERAPFVIPEDQAADIAAYQSPVQIDAKLGFRC
jgi:hypothetical protein